ncbi:unnamed protein product [Linum tenue]|uniref:Uncharacterized protein n=1 Tax=Linum tenue TaxID=586396 RepID=A0AAV0MVW1_9ROSI|nr:unnamed protein product [Linum tenue]
MEKYHFAEEIKNIVAYEGSDRVERHERADQWPRQLGRAGFQAVGFVQVYESSEDDALGLRVRWVYSGLASEKGFLLLGWKGSPIMLASAWQVHPHTASSAGSSFVRVSVMSKN